MPPYFSNQSHVRPWTTPEPSSAVSRSSRASSDLAAHTAASSTSPQYTYPTERRKSLTLAPFRANSDDNNRINPMNHSPNTSNGNGTFAEHRDHRETSANGFTAVNGKTTPPSASAPFSASESRSNNGGINGDRPTPRSVPPQGDRYPAGPGADRSLSRPHHLPHTDGHGSMSPLGGPLPPMSKRKRTAESPSDEEEDDDIDSSYAHDISRHSHSGWHNQSRLDDTEARLEQALTNNGAMHDSEPRSAHPDEDGSPDDYITTTAGVKVNPGKRKRAFTNRTKTGCQTCRRRKKKCDEAKPECQNCQRGGFKCEGYQAQKIFAKSASSVKSSPMPIQAKDADMYGQNSIYPRNEAPMQRPPPAPFPGTPTNHFPRHFDDEHDASRQWGSSTPYSAGPGPAPRHQYPPDRHPSDHGHSHGNGHGAHGSHPRQPPVPSYSTMSIAQQALSYNPVPSQRDSLGSSRNSGPHPPRIKPPTSEKAKMGYGDEYILTDPELVADREKCREAVTKYNSSFGVSREERERQLKAIIEPSTPGMTPNPAPATSRMGQGVTVEAPFMCDYGYKITLQDNVLIETGCVIADAKEVRIGKGAIIGPGVKIISKTTPFEWKDRAGPQPKAKGIAIQIDEYVFIGAGCVIAPAWDDKEGMLRIGAHAYIMPGTVVTKSVKSGWVFGVRDRDGPDHLGEIKRSEPPASTNRSDAFLDGPDSRFRHNGRS